LQSRERLEYSKKVCNPYPLDHPNTAKYTEFDVFKGFAFTYEDDKGDPSPFINHIKKIWCRDNETYTDYVLSWFAHMIQRPWERCNASLGVRGDKGSLKNIVVDEFISKILGERSYMITYDANVIFGNFNKSIEGKILVVNDEAVSSFDKSTMEY
jgi:hypothetical protein